MPYETTWSEAGIEWRFFGHVTPDETREADRIFYGDPRSDYASYQLIDLRDVTILDYPFEEQKLSAAIDGAASITMPGVRVAFIVPDGRFDEALNTYMEQLNATAWKARSFTDPIEARNWCERRGEDRLAERRRHLALDR